MTRTHYFILGIAALIVIALGVNYSRTSLVPATGNTATSTATSTPLGDGISITAPDGTTVTQLPDEVIKVPSLNRPITFAGSHLPADAQPIIKAKMEAVIATLKKNSGDLSAWLTLGVYRKQAGDFVGAEEAWVYVHTVAPADEISVLDLADLHMNFTKNYPKAEMYYKIAIANKADNLDNYSNLYNLYKFLYKTNTTLAADTKAQALKLFPASADYINSW